VGRRGDRMVARSLFDGGHICVTLRARSMSSGKLDRSGVFEPLTVKTTETQLTLPRNAVLVRRNGIEFRSVKSIPVWKEMTVSMQTHDSGGKVNFTGIVVACDGNRHAGYIVSMVFTSMSKQSQERLSQLSQSRLD
jgi:hypothetical protein